MDNQSPAQAPGSPIPAQAPPETKKGRGKTGLLVAFLIVILVLAAAIVSEMLYLIRSPEEKCKLLGCQTVEVITSSLPTPQPLNPVKLEWMKLFLDRLGPDRNDAPLFSEAEFTLISQGVVVNNIPEVIEENGVKYVYFLVILDQNQNPLYFRFTQNELDSMDASIVGFDGKVYEATVNDLTIGDSIVLKIVNDLLDSTQGDKIILEISRENP
jgi:hypothetical protein